MRTAANTILICHALCGDAHVAGRHSVHDRKPGWWDEAVGLALFDDLPEWRDELEFLTGDALQTVVAELQRLDLPQERWSAYLRTLALELPGWSGMFFWLHQRPGPFDGASERLCGLKAK